jgi:hypothetical protein
MAREIQGLIGQKLDDLGVPVVGGAVVNGLRSPRTSVEVTASAGTEAVARLQGTDLTTLQRFPRRQPTNQKDRNLGD